MAGKYINKFVQFHNNTNRTFEQGERCRLNEVGPSCRTHIGDIATWNQEEWRLVVSPFFPYITLISAFTAQTALLGFIFSSLLSLPECVTLRSRIIPVHVREREVRRKNKKKKAQKKTLRRDQDLNPQTLSPVPTMLSVRPQRPA